MPLARSLVLLTCLLGGACGKSRPPPTCAEVGAQVVALFAQADVPAGPPTSAQVDAHARDVGATFAARCAEDAWSAEMRACLSATRSLVAPLHCRPKLTEAQRTRLDEALVEVERAERARVIPAACVRYEALLARVMTCDAVPPEARAELRAKLEAAKQTWPGLPDKRTLEPICGAAIQTVKAVAADCPGAATW